MNFYLPKWHLRNFFILHCLITSATLLIIAYFLFFDQFVGFRGPKVQLILITPTYRRPERLADMTRLSQTLMHVKSNLHWIVVEDADETVSTIDMLLHLSGIPYTYLARNGTDFIKMAIAENPKFRSKGFAQRNWALQFVRQKYASSTGAVVYFADDDNSYDLRLFRDFLPNVKSIGFWAVGLAGNAFVEAPEVDENGTLVGWLVNNAPWRTFGIDMAGFGVNLKHILSSNATFHPMCAFPEDCFLRQFNISPTQCQLFGHNTKQVFVWHTKTTSRHAKADTYGYIVAE